MKNVTKDRILLSIANVTQATTTIIDCMEQKPFPRMVKLVWAMMVLIVLHVIDTLRIVVASKAPTSKMNTPVVGVSVLLRRSSRYEIVI